MERITRAHLDAKLATLNRLIPERQYHFDSAYNQLAVHDKSGHVSPRLPKRQLADWMDTFRQGIFAHQDHIEHNKTLDT